MTKMSNLPRDLEEEVLSRIPMTSLRRVRSTCKKWNTLSKRRSFAKKHLDHQAKVASEKEFTVVMMMDFKVYLMSINLHNNVESCIKRKGELISLDDEVYVAKVFHCDGLLLCITKDYSTLVVWNPYWGQIRRIEPKHNFDRLDMYSYALGHDKSSKSYKILSFVDCRHRSVYDRLSSVSTFFEYKIYDINSDSWRFLDVIQDWTIDFYDCGVSLKGNTYWFAKEKQLEEDTFLICFDFTRERFGPRLPLPFEWYTEDTATLSSVREEQLAVLVQRWDTLEMEIWVTTKIEPNTVSWNSKVFLAVNMRPFFDYNQLLFTAASFFIDEVKKVAVVFDKNIGMVRDENKVLTRNRYHNIAYIVGVDGSLKEVDLGEFVERCYPLGCSYVPSLVQLN